ncbi:MAG: phosphatidylglycerophosphatase A family protein [Paracoccaceae bacterium]
MRRLFLSACGAGFLKPAPGTWGSLAALPAAWMFYIIGGPYLIVIATLIALVLGIYATQKDMEATGDHDPSWIVIDEVVGQWIALLPIAFGATRAGVDVLALWPGIVTAFLAFRLFDIWKPGPIGWADRKDSAAGVMLDDVFAGLFAAIVVLILAYLAHQGFVQNVNPA